MEETVISEALGNRTYGLNALIPCGLKIGSDMVKWFVIGDYFPRWWYMAMCRTALSQINLENETVTGVWWAQVMGAGSIHKAQGLRHSEELPGP